MRGVRQIKCHITDGIWGLCVACCVLKSNNRIKLPLNQLIIMIMNNAAV
jgi:hypothetical protein